jgi:histone deacetylase 6
VSAGFDSAIGDPLGKIGVSPAGYAHMTQGLRSICKKVSVILEGGYNLDSLAVSASAVIKTLVIKPADKEGFNSLLSNLAGHKTTYEDMKN